MVLKFCVWGTKFHLNGSDLKASDLSSSQGSCVCVALRGELGNLAGGGWSGTQV